jgi:UDP-N-acetylglucosamine 2-epimerase (non-hydrolysing)
VDLEDRLRSFLEAFNRLQRAFDLPVVVSTHPRTRIRMEAMGAASANAQVRFLEPFGFFDFVTLEKQAFCVLSDSGTVQEECSIFGVPSVTIRDVTERPETIECGSGVLSGADPAQIESLVRFTTARASDWTPPVEYIKPNVSRTVLRILMGHIHQPGL